MYRDREQGFLDEMYGHFYASNPNRGHGNPLCALEIVQIAHYTLLNDQSKRNFNVKHAPVAQKLLQSFRFAHWRKRNIPVNRFSLSKFLIKSTIFIHVILDNLKINKNF